MHGFRDLLQIKLVWPYRSKFYKYRKHSLSSLRAWATCKYLFLSFPLHNYRKKLFYASVPFTSISTSLCLHFIAEGSMRHYASLEAFQILLQMEMSCMLSLALLVLLASLCLTVFFILSLIHCQPLVAWSFLWSSTLLHVFFQLSSYWWQHTIMFSFSCIICILEATCINTHSSAITMRSLSSSLSMDGCFIILVANSWWDTEFRGVDVQGTLGFNFNVILGLCYL